MLLKPWVLWLGLSLALAVADKWTVAGGWADSRSRSILGRAAGAAAGLHRSGAIPGEFRRPILYLAVLAVVVGISLNYIFLPIRAAQFPAINEGEPTTWDALIEVLNRAQYGKPPVTYPAGGLPVADGQLLAVFQLAVRARLGQHRQPRRDGALHPRSGSPARCALWQRDRRAFWASATLMFTLTFALIFYLNFKYGFSYPVDPSRGAGRREVRERDYFFVVSFAAFGAVGGGGLRGADAGHGRVAPGPVDRARRWAARFPGAGPRR